MKHYHHIAATTVVAAIIAFAQTNSAIAQTKSSSSNTASGINKEVTIQREIVVEEREANHIATLPTISLPAVENKRLRWTDRAVTPAIINHPINHLGPSPYKTRVDSVPYKGYVAASYFPILQSSLSAGYSIINRSTTNLGAWLQYDGSDYRGVGLNGSKLRLRDYTGSSGLSLTQDIGSIGALHASAAYTFATFNEPTFDSRNQQARQIHGTLGGHGQIADYDFAADVRHSFFAFAKPMTDQPEVASPLRESATDINLSAGYNFDDSHRASVTIKGASLISRNAYTLDMTLPMAELLATPRLSQGYASMTPSYWFAGFGLSAHVGMTFYQTWGTNRRFRVAPDIRVSYTESSIFAVYGNLTGGDVATNSIAGLFTLNHHINPSLTYGCSPTIINGEIGFTIGPFSGVSLQAWAAAGRIDQAIMPAIPGIKGTNIGVFVPLTLSTRRVGVAVNAAIDRYATVRLAYECSPGTASYTKAASATNFDRARHVATARLDVAPIGPLRVGLGYTFRTNRNVYVFTPRKDTSIGSAIINKISLGRIHSLDLNASWQFTPELTATLTVENMLNLRWSSSYGIPSKGITGLAGVTYRF